MEANYTYYEIDTSDTWSYFRERVILGEYPAKVAKLLIDKIQPLIVTNCEPLFGVEMYDSGSESDKIYYSRQVEEYKKAINNIIDEFRIDYFFNKYNCYQYDEQIIIKKDDADFEYWFALKFSQYDSKIYELPHFLQYHLNNSFNDEFDELNKFIKLVLRQYTAEYLSDKVIFTVNEWLEKQYITSNKSLRISEKNKGSFTLTKESIILDNPQKIKQLIDDLKDKKFIDQSSSSEKGKLIFSGKPIKKSDRIVWTGTNLELKLFVQGLKKTNKINISTREIWDVTCNCFVKANNIEFENNQLRSSKGIITERIEHLNSFIKKI